MECRVNQTSRYGSVIAFSGCEYVKYEWRPVPAEREDEARRHPYLEIKSEDAGEPIAPKAEEPKEESPAVLIDASDGIDQAEASVAGKALATKRTQDAKKHKGGR